jgi:hypothetical protein
VSDRVRQIVKDQYEANAEAARRGTVADCSTYKHLVGWLDGADYVLEAIAEAERKLGIG